MVGRITYGCPNINKANLRDVIAATGLVILPKLNLKRRFFSPCDLEIWWMTSKNYRAPLLHYIKLCASSQTPRCSGQNRWFFVPYDLEIWWMTLKNNRTPLPCCIKLCASFQSHRWIRTGVTFRKCSIRVRIGDFLSHVILKFDGWPWKTTGHLFYVASSFVHHFIAMGEFKLKLQSGNAQFGSKSTIYCPCDLETIGHLFYVASSFVHHFVVMGEFKLKLQSGNAQFGSKSAIFFCPMWPWNLTDYLEKQ